MNLGKPVLGGIGATWDFSSSEIFRMMVTDKRYGLSVNLIATKVLPLLIPQLVNPQLQYEDFVIVHEVLQEMFDVVDK